MMKNLVLVSHPATESLNENSMSHIPIIAGVKHRRCETVNSSSITNTGASFSFQPPSNTMLDKCIRLKLKVQIQHASAITNVNKLCVRAFPIDHVVRNCSLTINGSTLSQNLSELVPLSTRVHSTVDERSAMNSNCPNFIDMRSNNSTEVIEFSSERTRENLVGGDFSNFDTGTTVTNGYEFEVSQGLNMPLLAKSTGQGLANCTNVAINVAFNNLKTMLRTGNADGAADDFADMTITLVDAKLQVVYYSIDSEIGVLPAVVNHCYQTSTPFRKSVGTVANGVQPARQVSDNFKLSSVPSHVVVYVAPKIGDLEVDARKTLNPLPITRLDVTINNQSGLLAGCTPEDLASISRSNALNGIDSLVWTKYASTFVGRVNKDLCADVVEGAKSVFNCQVTVDLGKNQTGASSDYELVVVFIQESNAAISENNMSTSIGHMTEELKMALEQGFSDASYADYEKTDYSRLTGAGWFSCAMKNLYHGLKSGVHLAREGISTASDLKNLVGGTQMVTGGGMTDMVTGGSEAPRRRF